LHFDNLFFCFFDIGDSSSIPFVGEPNYPKNEKERLAVVKKMTAHANYCLSGDSTLQGIQIAISEIVKEPAGILFFFFFFEKKKN